MKKSKNDCIGCKDNFYNGNNPYGVKECWCFEGAKKIKRKKVGLNDVPPWDWKPQKFLDCRREKGYVFINCEKEDRKY